MPVNSNYQIARLPNYQILHHRQAIGFLILLTIPFWIAVTCPFLNFDDPAYVSNNPMVLGGLSGQSIQWAFTTTTGGFWLPLTWLSLMLDATLFGAGPIGFHATNILFHLANAVLVYFLLDTLTRARWRSLLVAALFAIHPLRVESVAWITERKDVLALFFGLLALIAWVRYAGAMLLPRSSWEKHAVAFLLSLAFFALSLMAKPMLVTLPFILLLLDYWPLNRVPALFHRRTLSLLLEKIPFFLLAAAAIAINYAIQRHDHSIVDSPVTLRLQTALVNAALYLRDTFYFGKLSILYPLPDFIPAWEMLAAGFLLFAIPAAIVAARKKLPDTARPILVGWLWFLGSLVPFLGLLQSGPQSRADRFSYFPSIGLFLALVFAFPHRSRSPSSVIRHLSFVISITILLTLAFFTTTRLLRWRDPLHLYLDGIAHTQNNVRLEVLTATLLRDQTPPRFPEAREHYLAAMQISPRDPEIPTMLALLYIRANRVDLALPYFRKACELAPNDPAFADNYRKALQMRGEMRP